MKHVSKFFRCSFVLLLALIVAFSAAIGVAAVDATANGALLYTDTSNNVIRITEGAALDFSPDNMGFRTPLTYQAQNTYVVTVTIAFSYFSPLNLFTNNTTCAYYGNTTISNESQFNLSNLDDINVIVNSVVNSDSTTAKYILTFNTNNIDSSATLLQYFFTPNLSVDNQIDFRYLNTTVSYTYDPNETTLEDINNQLNDIKNNQESNNEEIQEALGNIINNQIIQNNNWTTIINYGSDYDHIDSNLIGNLGSAEDQLNSAEDALQNRSKSLIQRAASGIASAKTASQTLVSALSTTVPQIVSSTTDIVETAPEEVQAAVLSIPLLSFAAWLIGLKK